MQETPEVAPRCKARSRVFTFTSGTFQHFWGMQIQQKFDMFSHVFYNFVPDEGWMFAIDGPHPLPH